MKCQYDFTKADATKIRAKYKKKYDFDNKAVPEIKAQSFQPFVFA